MLIPRLWRRRLSKTLAALSLLQPVSFCFLHSHQTLWKLVAECFQVAQIVHPTNDSSSPFCPLRLSFFPRGDARLLRAHSFPEESDCCFVQEEIRHVRRLHGGIWAPKRLHAGLLHGSLKANAAIGCRRAYLHLANLAAKSIGRQIKIRSTSTWIRNRLPKTGVVRSDGTRLTPDWNLQSGNRAIDSQPALAGSKKMYKPRHP